jgi:prevent-host-death family protein
LTTFSGLTQDELMADRPIGAKELRASLPKIVARVRKGEHYIVMYRSRPAFRVVPVTEAESIAAVPLAEDPLYEAEAVGSSKDGLSSADHDAVLYGEAK